MLALAVAGVLALVLGAPLIAVFALVRMRVIGRELADVRVELAALRSRVERLTRPAAPPPPPPPPGEAPVAAEPGTWMPPAVPAMPPPVLPGTAVLPQRAP